ncbi:MAG TPA: TonB-dependent receptor [Allosphingosinicella sp.]|jgi:outer membrane receptor protein involved in Fe transport
MRNFGLLGTSALGSFTFIGLSLALAGPANAQVVAEDDATATGTVGQSETEIESGTEAETGAQGESAATGEGEQQITVTGSRIRRPNLESAVPITSIGGEEFFQTAQTSVGDVLNELPQLRSTFSQANSTRFLGTRGLNLLDLRGLGTQRTLVLVNGRRHVPGDVLNNAVSPDVNTFPTDLIERVDVITGGGSSIYGSDAIAGTVNFILKSNYDGFQVRGQSGITQFGDAANRYVSVLAGRNFAGDRGNVAINLEFASQDDYYAGSGGRGLEQVNGFLIVDTDPAGSVNGSDGNPDRVFFRDIRAGTIAIGGLTNVRFANSTPICGADVTGAAFTCTALFDETGRLQPQTGTRVGLAPNGSFIGGNGYSGREGRLVALSPQLTRYAANLIGHFEISPAIVPFIEAKYVRADAFGSQSGPFFSQGQTLGDGIAVAGVEDRSFFLPGARGTSPGLVNREGIRLDNPFLSPQARALLTQQLLATTINPNTGAAFVQGTVSATNPTPQGPTPAQQLAMQRAQILDGSFRFALRKNFVELGIRDELFRRETYRAVVGVRGEFNDDWNYEISGNYGEHRESNTITGNINRQRFLLAQDAALNAQGQIVCRSQIDPRFAGTDRGGNPAQLAADIAACVPLNPFGTGASSQAVRDYLTVESSAEGKITQMVVGGFVSGDLSQLFELPGGPVAFSVGAEYRRETVVYDLDDLTQAGYAFYNAIPSFTAPSFKVKEAFAEVSIPLLKDMPGFQELTITGSGRVSDYKGSTGTTYAYGVEATWRPIQDIRFRGSYNRAVRAPNLVELFSAQGQNFAPNFTDPCSERNLGTGSTTRAANCAALGRPAGYDFVYSSSLDFVSGGNPNLKEESSDNYTAGFVLTPRFIPGLSISADYYDITVNDVIASVAAQTIVNQCVDSPTIENPFCGAFQRAGASGGPRGEQPFRILEGSLLSAGLNFASLKVRGVDTEVAYRKKFDWGTASLRGTWTHTIQNDTFLNPTNPDFANRLLRELGDPQDEVNVNASIKAGKYTLGYQVRWIGKQYLNTYEDYNELNGLPPQNADYADRVYYPAVFYHDVRFGIDVTERFNFYMGIDNVTNRLPPLGLTGVGGGSGIFDVRGRNFYAGAIAKF